MKLPERKQKELEKKGKPDAKQVPGGGAMGRLRQFEEERGIEETDSQIRLPKSRGKPSRRLGQKNRTPIPAHSLNHKLCLTHRLVPYPFRRMT